MKITTIYRFLLIVIAGSFTLAPVLAQKDAKAKALLDKTSTALNQAGGISASFTLHIKDDISDIQQSFEGQMFLKAEKFCFDTPEQAIYYDGKTQWVYQKPIGEVSILEPQPQDVQSLNPISIFEMYKKDCDYKHNGDKTDIQKRKVQEVSLFPKDKKEDIKQVDIQINPVDNMPVFFHIVFNNRSEYRIHISKYQTKQNLSDSQFVFDKSKFPQVEVNDLR
jgi:outer membrane lipoprotein-sorting protein